MRNRMIAMALVGISFFTVCSFTVNKDSKNNVSEVNSNPKDLDVQMILKGLGIATSADETKYASVKVDAAAAKGFNLGFNNPTAKPYSLVVFDTDGNMIASVDNIEEPSVSLPPSMFNKGSYIYKLTGEGNTYAGKFFYQ